MRIPWRYRVINESVLNIIGRQPTVLKMVKGRKLEFFGSIIRNGKHTILMFVMSEKIKDRRGYGRRRIS